MLYWYCVYIYFVLQSQHTIMVSVLMCATKVNYKLIVYGSFYALQVGAIWHASYAILLLVYKLLYGYTI